MPAFLLQPLHHSINAGWYAAVPYDIPLAWLLPNSALCLSPHLLFSDVNAVALCASSACNRAAVGSGRKGREATGMRG